jgi:lipoprotein-anchoring transpeptidase ErfK/SrfK
MRAGNTLFAPIVIRFGGKAWRLSPYVLIAGAASLFVIALVTSIALGAFVIAGSVYSSGNILPGVRVQGAEVNNVSVGGLSEAVAAAQLGALKIDQKITLKDGARTWQVSSADLGVKVDGEATAQKAAQVGHDANGIFGAMPAMLGTVQIAPVYTIDLAKASDALQALSAAVNIKPDTATSGRSLNIDATLDALPPDVATLLAHSETNLVLDVEQGPRTEYTVQRGEELGLIAKKFNIPIDVIAALNQIGNADQIYPGQTLIIPAAGVYVPTEAESPPAPLAQGKAIVVSLSNQRIYAYQDGHLVHSSLMSSGVAGDETVQGDYHIYVKYVTTRMTGPGYDIPDVPWTMYFYKGYGIHGAYWHDDFGRTMSHGCVNLDTSEAKWFYDFSPVGTLVRVIPTFNAA